MECGSPQGPRSLADDASQGLSCVIQLVSTTLSPIPARQRGFAAGADRSGHIGHRHRAGKLSRRNRRERGSEAWCKLVNWKEVRCALPAPAKRGTQSALRVGEKVSVQAKRPASTAGEGLHRSSRCHNRHCLSRPVLLQKVWIPTLLTQNPGACAQGREALREISGTIFAVPPHALMRDLQQWRSAPTYRWKSPAASG